MGYHFDVLQTKDMGPKLPQPADPCSTSKKIEMACIHPFHNKAVVLIMLHTNSYKMLQLSNLLGDISD